MLNSSVTHTGSIPKSQWGQLKNKKGHLDNHQLLPPCVARNIYNIISMLVAASMAFVCMLHEHEMQTGSFSSKHCQPLENFNYSNTHQEIQPRVTVAGDKFTNRFIKQPSFLDTMLLIKRPECLHEMHIMFAAYVCVSELDCAVSNMFLFYLLPGKLVNINMKISYTIRSFTLNTLMSGCKIGLAIQIS